jgi:hypothetical protein
MTKTENADGKTIGTIAPDFADEIIDSAALTHEGAKRTPQLNGGKK